MKKLSYIFLLIFGIVLFNSCEEDNDISKIKDGPILAKFESYNINLVGLADGSEYNKQIQVRITGPNIANLSSDITITVARNENSTANEGDHYRIAQKTITLTKSNDYLGNIDIVIVSEGNAPPMDGTPEFEAYVAPVLNLDITSAEGDASVIPTGKSSKITLNFIPPNPYAGLYSTEIFYYHPTLGGSHPSMGADFDPTDPFDHVIQDKELVPITGRKCETFFATFDETDLCWITVNVDNSVSFTNDYEVFGQEAKLGDPWNPGLVSHFDPETRVIYLYYHYVHTNGTGTRVFYETFTPYFK